MNSQISVLAFKNNDFLKLILTIFLGYIAIRLISKILSKNILTSKFDPTIVAFLNGFIKFILNITFLIIILSMLGIPMTTFIAMLSAVGLAVALALQGNLSNFASTLMILTFKPFKVGDFIESQNQIGTVKEIQMLFTHILTPENKKIIIPNSELVNSRIINYSSEENRRIDLVFSASYENDVEVVKDILLKVVCNHELILEDPQPVIRLSAHGQNSLDYDVKIWVRKENYWTVRYDLHEIVREQFLQQNITIPYPQHVVWMNRS